MVLVTLLLLVALPLFELWVFVQVAREAGFVLAVVLLLACSALGVVLVRIQGLAALARLRRHVSTSAAGRPPTAPDLGDDIADRVVRLGAAALLVVPGFVTAAAGLLLLLPPFTRLARGRLLGRVRSGRWGRTRIIRATYSGPIDVDGRPERDDGGRPPRGSIGP